MYVRSVGRWSDYVNAVCTAEIVFVTKLTFEAAVFTGLINIPLRSLLSEGCISLGWLVVTGITIQTQGVARVHWDEKRAYTKGSSAKLSHGSAESCLDDVHVILNKGIEVIRLMSIQCHNVNVNTTSMSHVSSNYKVMSRFLPHVILYFVLNKVISSTCVLVIFRSYDVKKEPSPRLHSISVETGVAPRF